MSKCTLKIVLDLPQPTYAAGEKVTGRIEVSASEDCECQKLSLSRAWRTRGHGEDAFGKPEEQVLFNGAWRAGQNASYPFEFVAPIGPLSYHGEMFNVEWYLHAQAAITGALDASTDEGFRLVAAEVTPGFNLGPAFRGVGSHQKLMKFGQTLAQGCGLITGVFFLLFSLVLGLIVRDVFRRAATPGPPEWSWLIVWLLFAAGTAALLFWVLRPIIARRKLGPVEAQVTPGIVRPGEAVTCSLRFQPRANIDLSEATATLRGMEIVDWQSGDETHTRRCIISEQPVTFAQDRRLMAGESIPVETSLSVPANAPTTFMSAHQQLLWLVNLRLRLRGWPDWTYDIPLIVRP
jgi:hypothetical protein